VRRLVLTSSSRAVCTPTPGKAMKAGMETWNSEAVAAMRDPVTLAEQAGVGRGCGSAGWRRGSRSNAILSATCMGPVLAP
jgi:hypothetical protein